MARRPLAKHSVARNWSDGVRYAGKSSKCMKRSEVRAAAAAAAQARERERATERGMRGRGGGGQPRRARRVRRGDFRKKYSRRCSAKMPSIPNFLFFVFKYFQYQGFLCKQFERIYCS